MHTYLHAYVYVFAYVCLLMCTHTDGEENNKKAAIISRQTRAPTKTSHETKSATARSVGPWSCCQHSKETAFHTTTLHSNTHHPIVSSLSIAANYQRQPKTSSHCGFPTVDYGLIISRGQDEKIRVPQLVYRLQRMHNHTRFVWTFATLTCAFGGIGYKEVMFLCHTLKVRHHHGFSDSVRSSHS